MPVAEWSRRSYIPALDPSETADNPSTLIALAIFSAATKTLFTQTRRFESPRRLTNVNGWIAEYAVGRSERVTRKTDAFTADGASTIEFPLSA